VVTFATFFSLYCTAAVLLAVVDCRATCPSIYSRT
jgi:hypothetical protein